MEHANAPARERDDVQATQAHQGCTIKVWKAQTGRASEVSPLAVAPKSEDDA